MKRKVEATKINGRNKIHKAINLISFVIEAFIIQILSSNFQLFKSLIMIGLINLIWRYHECFLLDRRRDLKSKPHAAKFPRFLLQEDFVATQLSTSKCEEEKI